MGEVFAGPGFRACSKPGCGWPAVATLGFDYEARTAWVGDLATVEDPSAYDLCAVHSSRFKVPRDWSFTDSRAPQSSDATAPASQERRSLLDDWPEAVTERNDPLDWDEAGSERAPRQAERQETGEVEKPTERPVPQASTAAGSAQPALLDF